MAILMGAVATVFGFILMLVGNIFPNISFTQGHMFDYDPYRDVLVAAAYYLLTLFGIFSSMMYRRLEAKGWSDAQFEIREIVSKQDFVRAVIISPIVFIFVLNSFGKDANLIMSFVFSYQNGFFWEMIVKKQTLKQEGTIKQAA
jgi:hypothetical protein